MLSKTTIQTLVCHTVADDSARCPAALDRSHHTPAITVDINGADSRQIGR